MSGVPAIPAEVAAGINQVQSSIRRLGVDEKNNFQNYAFVSIDKFLEFVGPHMAEAGIFFIFDEVESDVRIGLNDKGGQTTIMFSRWNIFIVHKSGAVAGPFTRSVIVQGGMAQAFGSAQSYLWKQFARGMFSIPTGDKDDPDLYSNDIVASTAPKPVQRAAAPVAERTQKADPPTMRSPEPAGGTAAEAAELREAYKTLKGLVAGAASDSILTEIELRNDDFMAELKVKQPEAHRTMAAMISKRHDDLRATEDRFDGDDLNDEIGV